MMTIKRIADVALTNIYGSPINFAEEKPEDASAEWKPKITQATVSQRTFLITMASDPTCAQSQGKTGIDALLYVKKIREDIAEQSNEVVAARGYWKFEDDRAKGLREAAKKPTGQFGYGLPLGNQMVSLPHCIVDFVEATCDMTPEPKQEAKQLNGAEKALPEAARA